MVRISNRVWFEKLADGNITVTGNNPIILNKIDFDKTQAPDKRGGHP
jgi:hypothetical protein